jgi:hypothetical protein
MVDTISQSVLCQEKGIRTDYVDQLNMGSHNEFNNVLSDSHLNIDDGLHNPETNLNLLFENKNLMQIRSWLVIEHIYKNDFSQNSGRSSKEKCLN